MCWDEREGAEGVTNCFYRRKLRERREEDFGGVNHLVRLRPRALAVEFGRTMAAGEVWGIWKRCGVGSRKGAEA